MDYRFQMGESFKSIAMGGTTLNIRSFQPGMGFMQAFKQSGNPGYNRGK